MTNFPILQKPYNDNDRGDHRRRGDTGRPDPAAAVRRLRDHHNLMKELFGFTLRDVDCDFRLIRRSAVARIRLHYDSGAICVEMVKKLQDAAGTGGSIYGKA